MADLRSLLAQDLDSKDLIVKMNDLLQSAESLESFGSFSTAVYDTAWVSMVKNKSGSDHGWLVPESFEYVLLSQQTDGTWESYKSPVDGILNTLASLLALLVHQSADDGQHVDLNSRIERASKGLDTLLQVWSVHDAVHVGFEILVPRLLSMIADFEMKFEFPGQEHLLHLYTKKIDKFKPEMTYSAQSTTILHSLEAFAGIIDFDKVAHHCDEKTGIFGSPAATSAYLINCTVWDKRAETYLRKVVRETGNGGVPSAFPTSIFESSWSLSTLLSHIVSKDDLDPITVESLASFYHRILTLQGGVTGFAPSLLEDADDTARSLLTLNRLGARADIEPMINTFSSPSCFRSYQFEGNPSFTANCNVLLTILCHDEIDQHLVIVEQTVRYLLEVWNTGDTKDKWNLSPFYSSMLLADVLVTLLKRIDGGHLKKLPAQLTKIDVPVVLCQLLSKTLSCQQKDGTWGDYSEETAYGMIAIAICCRLPWHLEVRRDLVNSYNQALESMSRMNKNKSINDTQHSYLWVEKVTYGSPLLRKAYYMTAVKISLNQSDWSEGVKRSFTASPEYASKVQPLLSQLPLLAGSTIRRMELTMIEASRLAERLQNGRNRIFPRDELPMSKDNYLKFIPIIWTMCNSRRGLPLSPACLWEMILISMLNYQVDEYMETVIQTASPSELSLSLTELQKTCDIDGWNDVSTFLSHVDASNAPGKKHVLQSDCKSPDLPPSGSMSVLSGYIGHVRNHPATLRLSSSDQRSLSASLYAFLISHIAQNINSHAFHGSGERGTRALLEAQRGYSAWVRTSASDSTSCPVSFQFFMALLTGTAAVEDGSRSARCTLLESPRVNYLSRVLAGHLATLCRMYNDYGSVARDAAEGSLNSLDFDEFCETRKDRNAGMQKAKDVLLGLAEFEREAMEMAFKALRDVVVDDDIMRAVRVFVDVTDMFGQIYIRKDIASRVKKNQAEAGR